MLDLVLSQDDFSIGVAETARYLRRPFSCVARHRAVLQIALYGICAFARRLLDRGRRDSTVRASPVFGRFVATTGFSAHIGPPFRYLIRRTPLFDRGRRDRTVLIRGNLFFFHLMATKITTQFVLISNFKAFV
jgi:hypothetical protein